MKSNNVQEVCEDQLSEISSQAASNTFSGPKLALDLSLTVTAAATATTTAEWSTTDSNGTQAAREPMRVFTCNYCQRKFFSSQALGGTRTRTGGSARWPGVRCTSSRPTPTATPTWPPSRSAARPGIGIQAHASVHPRRRRRSGSSSRMPPSARRQRPHGLLLGDDEEVSFGCPSSFRLPPLGADVLPLLHSGHNLGSSGSIVVQADEEPDLTL